MIVKTSVRGGGRYLADHLTKTDENEQVIISSSRDLVSGGDVHAAIAEMNAQAAAWRASSPNNKKYLDHAHISPDRAMTAQEWEEAWAEYEREFGLRDAPYIEVAHVKANREEHRHRAYLRVDADRVALWKEHDNSHNYARGEKVSRVLEYRFGHTLTHGKHDVAVMAQLRRDGRAEIAEWIGDDGRRYEGGARSWTEHQIEKRSAVKRELIADVVSQCWQQADSAKAFDAALAERGLVLARGKQRKDGSYFYGVVAGVPTGEQPVFYETTRQLNAHSKATKTAIDTAKLDLSVLSLPTSTQAFELQRQQQAAVSDLRREREADQKRPTPEEIASRRAERQQTAAEARAAKRAAWIAERKAEHKAAKDSLWEQYQRHKDAGRADAKPTRELAWKIEAQQRDRERHDLKFDMAQQRRLVSALTPPGLRFLSLAAHKHFVADRKWSELKEQQSKRWNDTKAQVNGALRGKPWREWVNGLAAFGDERAKLVAGSWQRHEAAKAAPKHKEHRSDGKRDFTERSSRFDKPQFARNFGRDSGAAAQPHLAQSAHLSATQSVANLRFAGVPGRRVADIQEGQNRNASVLLPRLQGDGVDLGRAGRADELRRSGVAGRDGGEQPGAASAAAGGDQRRDGRDLQVKVEPFDRGGFKFKVSDTDQEEIRAALIAAGGQQAIHKGARPWVFERDPTEALTGAGIAVEAAEIEQRRPEAEPPALSAPAPSWQDLPGLDTRGLDDAQKAALKAEYGLRWDRERKVWQAPDDHPLIDQARDRWETLPEPEPEPETAPAPSWQDLPGLDTRGLDDAQKAALKAEYGLRWDRERKVWQAPDDHPLIDQARDRWETLPEPETAPAEEAAAAETPETAPQIRRLPELDRYELRESLIEQMQAVRNAERQGSESGARRMQEQLDRRLKEIDRRSATMPAIDAWRELRADYDQATDLTDAAPGKQISPRQLRQIETRLGPLAMTIRDDKAVFDGLPEKEQNQIWRQAKQHEQTLDQQKGKSRGGRGWDD